MGKELLVAFQSGAPTIDAGVLLPNINDDYTGEAPDIGPYEQGKPIPHYGPRE